MLMVAALLAVAAGSPAPLLAIPGTSLRLGTPMARVDSLVGFRATGGPSTTEKHHGHLKYFGVLSDADANFAAGVLTRAEFVLNQVSTHTRDYIEDQLRLSGMHRECAQWDAQGHDCVWAGPVTLHVVWKPGHLSVEAAPPEPAAGAGADSAAGAADSAKTMARAPSPASAAAPALTPATSPAPAVAAATPAGAASPPPAPAPSPIAKGAAALATPMIADTLVFGDGAPARGSRPPTLAAQAPAVAYPPDARGRGVEGDVLILVTVDASGAVNETTFLRGVPELNDAALEFVRALRFTPLTLNGAITRFRIVVDTRYRLH